MNNYYNQDFYNFIDAAYTVEDKKMSANLLQMWTDFVKTSNPTPSSNQWTRYTLKI